MSFVGRPLHFVIRSSDLGASLNFLKGVFGMRVLRHEENHEPCAISCNGPYNNSWSKTMIGYGVEDVSYCIEITYNYGKKNYKSDDSIQFFGIIVSDVSATLSKAEDLGYSVDAHNIITGPDDYKYKPLAKPEKARSEPFAGVRLRVSDLERSADFYINVIGMKQLSVEEIELSLGEPEASVKSIYVGYDPTYCVYQLIEDPSKGELNVESGWQGRNALGPAQVTEVYQRHKSRDGIILHEKSVLTEEPFMEIFIARDPDGYELCLISHDSFCHMAASATDYKEPDWKRRAKFLETHEWDFTGPLVN
eukprot:TRINITY_DN1551_c0_g2_i5.p1 TRINITY_DN1551_c0_g2~~TRINITY_DN1551_c0_g2_i5.p1  ORF type:complete len:330 (+),score=52.86 TRINITY_DN1551_c0_g2_i5:70-990(+)